MLQLYNLLDDRCHLHPLPKNFKKAVHLSQHHFFIMRKGSASVSADRDFSWRVGGLCPLKQLYFCYCVTSFFPGEGSTSLLACLRLGQDLIDIVVKTLSILDIIINAIYISRE